MRPAAHLGSDRVLCNADRRLTRSPFWLLQSKNPNSTDPREPAFETLPRISSDSLRLAIMLFQHRSSAGVESWPFLFSLFPAGVDPLSKASWGNPHPTLSLLGRGCNPTYTQPFTKSYKEEGSS